MATASSSSFPPYDRSVPILSDNPPLSTQPRRVVSTNPNPAPPRPGQHLDDADLLAWKRQYANISLREQNMMSNSAEDLTQLIDRNSYQFESFGHDYNDMDDDEIHFDNGAGYDYETAIQDRLKRANEEFEHDATPAELKHRQRVSFDAVVKAVDIVQDPQEYTTTGAIPKPVVSPVHEEPPSSIGEVQDDTNRHQYTVPLNDTQPKEGPSLLQQLKAMQFHGIPPTGDRWSSTRTNGSNEIASPTETSTSSTSTLQTTNDPHKSMVVSVNGGFELQTEDDYTAKRSATKSASPKSSDEEDGKGSSTVKKLVFLPTPPSDGRGDDHSPKSQAPHRSYPPLVRPKSSDPLGRSENGKSGTTKSLSDLKTKPDGNGQTRAKSAGVLKMSTVSYLKSSSGVDYDEMNRKAAEKKRAQLREENRKKEEAEKKRKEELEKAKESFEKWMRDKDTERKRLNEEKRMEREEHDSRQLECNKELAQLREDKYQKWVERKNREVMMAHEFKKLQASEEEVISGDSSSSNNQNHRAFHRWLRRKYEQSKEEKRQLRLEQRRLRRRQRRSIKRFQLLQDLQLAKSFGYS